MTAERERPAPSAIAPTRHAVPVPDYVVRPATGPYRSLNPATKFVVALFEAALGFVTGGWVGSAVALVAVTASGLVAGVGRELARAVALMSPGVASVVLINSFLLPGATDPIARLGPLAPTWTGLVFGLEVTLRLLAMSLALALAYLTTEVDDLLADLERRGLGRRAIFILGAALTTVPSTVERARQIVDAQRARGLDTEGRAWRRARGVIPLAAPLVAGAMTEVEERTVALEGRAFSAPGRRTLLRIPADSARQRAVRWLLLGLLAAFVALRAAGLVPEQ